MSDRTIGKKEALIAISVAGLFLVAFYVFFAIRLPVGDFASPGPGIFPIAVGVVSALSCLATLAEGLRTSESERIDFPHGPDLRKFIFLIAALILFAVGISLIGFVPSAFLFCLVTIFRVYDQSLLRSLIVAAIMTGLISALFVLLLKVPLPRGLLGL